MTAGRTSASLDKDWGTPFHYVKAVKMVFGGKIHLDPCSNEYSVVNAEVEYKLPQKDGLLESWNFSTIYVNPPYGVDKKRGTRIAHWLEKCLEAHKKYESEVIALIPVATNTGHWKKNIWGEATAVCFLYDTRLKFTIKGKSQGKGAPMSCATIYWGNHYNKFFNVFMEFGIVIDLRPLQKIEKPMTNLPLLKLISRRA